jgi:hypothetical protein
MLRIRKWPSRRAWIAREDPVEQVKACFFASYLALLVLKPMRQRAMAEELFPDALGITRV